MRRGRYWHVRSWQYDDPPQTEAQIVAMYRKEREAEDKLEAAIQEGYRRQRERK